MLPLGRRALGLLQQLCLAVDALARREGMRTDELSARRRGVCMGSGRTRLRQLTHTGALRTSAHLREEMRTHI